MTKLSAPIRPQQSLLPWDLTAGIVVAGPPLLPARRRIQPLDPTLDWSPP